MTLHENGVFPLQAELSKGHLKKKNLDFEKNSF